MISKSDFKLGSTCVKKLDYKRRNFPNRLENDEYMRMLAEGGYFLGYLATLLYPQGVEVNGSAQEALTKTEEQVQRRNITLYEAAFRWEDRYARVDILKKEGDHVSLVEVKSRSIDGNKLDLELEDKKFQEILDDIAFQYLILKRLHPHWTIIPYLLLPNSARKSSVADLYKLYSIELEKSELHEGIRLNDFTKPVIRKNPAVDFKEEDLARQIAQDGWLIAVEVQKWVTQRLEAIESRSRDFVQMERNGGFRLLNGTLSKGCKECEFRTESEHLDGFSKCWGNLARATPHIFDLYSGGSVKHQTRFYLDELISQGKCTFRDIDQNILKGKKSEPGGRYRRQYMQIKGTLEGCEIRESVLPEEISQWKFPLYFIDFETYSGCIPLFHNLAPYEWVAFQFSCHILEEPNGPLHHREWFQSGDQFPNFDFARELRKVIRDTGTVLMWARHEKSVLKHIQMQLLENNEPDPDLQVWLGRMPNRMVDMNELCLKGYFHPAMKGQTSIKKVLPAIWATNTNLHKNSWFSDFVSRGPDKKIMDPYEVLRMRMKDENNGGEDDIVNGTAAMRAYIKLMQGLLSLDQKERLIEKLKQYCFLDTLSMVIIYEHWKGPYGVFNIT